MNHNHPNGGMKHMLLMLACCLIPIAGILAIRTFGISVGPLSGLLPFAMSLLCPLMMIFMMKGMMQGPSQAEHHYQEMNEKLSPLIPEPAPTEISANGETERPHCH